MGSLKYYHITWQKKSVLKTFLQRNSKKYPNSEDFSYKARLEKEKWLLTLYHTIPTFNDLEKEAFWKQWGLRRKCWLPPFPAMFSTQSKTDFAISTIFKLSSANTLNLDQSIILTSGKEVNQKHYFRQVQFEKCNLPYQRKASPLKWTSENAWNVDKRPKFMFLSANAFNLDQSKILSFGSVKALQYFLLFRKWFQTLNALPNDKNLDCFTLKAVADDKINVTE